MSPDLSPCTNEFGRDRLAAAESWTSTSSAPVERQTGSSKRQENGARSLPRVA